MKIYKSVIAWAGSLDTEIDNIYWDKNAAIRDAKEIIKNDEKTWKDAFGDYDIDYVMIYTEVPDDNGAFRTIDQYKVEHTKREDNEA